MLPSVYKKTTESLPLGCPWMNPSPHNAEDSHFSDAPGKPCFPPPPRPGTKGNMPSTPDACLLSWSLWQLHPAAAPWFGWGTGLAIPRKCLPPVQAGIPAHTPLVVVEGGLMECFLSAGQGDLGTTWGLQPSPSQLGKCPVQCPFHGHLPPPNCVGA